MAGSANCCAIPRKALCPGDFHIDPVRPVARAVITHGHSDHARSGHGACWPRRTLAIMTARYARSSRPAPRPCAYGQTIARNAVSVSLVPPGMCGLGPAVLRWKGDHRRGLGRYKRRRDPTCPPSSRSPATSFSANHLWLAGVSFFPPSEDRSRRALKSVALFPERTHSGRRLPRQGQRIIRLLREAGYGKTALHAWRDGQHERAVPGPGVTAGAGAGHQRGAHAPPAKSSSPRPRPLRQMGAAFR